MLKKFSLGKCSIIGTARRDDSVSIDFIESCRILEYYNVTSNCDNKHLREKIRNSKSQMNVLKILTCPNVSSKTRECNIQHEAYQESASANENGNGANNVYRWICKSKNGEAEIACRKTNEDNLDKEGIQGQMVTIDDYHWKGSHAWMKIEDRSKLQSEIKAGRLTLKNCLRKRILVSTPITKTIMKIRVGMEGPPLNMWRTIVAENWKGQGIDVISVQRMASQSVSRILNQLFIRAERTQEKIY